MVRVQKRFLKRSKVDLKFFCMIKKYGKYLVVKFFCMVKATKTLKVTRNLHDQKDQFFHTLPRNFKG